MRRKNVLQQIHAVDEIRKGGSRTLNSITHSNNALYVSVHYSGDIWAIPGCHAGRHGDSLPAATDATTSYKQWD